MKEDPSSEETPPASSRPRRSTTKNVLYNNDDYVTEDFTGGRERSTSRNSRKEVKEKGGPPNLSHVSGEESEVEDSEGEAPCLEENPLAKKRGRRPVPVKEKVAKPTAPKPPPGELVPRALLASTHHVRLLHDELDTTSNGDVYATVINGCLSEFLRKERVIELLTNPESYAAFDQAWMIASPPKLPPLTTDTGVFVFYVDGSQCKNAKDISFDDLRPWSVVSDPNVQNSINIKPNVRRHPVAMLDGVLRVVRHETRLADYHLTEYSARLPREQRLRKKIFYMSRDNCIYGNVLIIYNYEKPGKLPVPLFAPHGNDHLRRVVAPEVADPTDDETPFEDEPYEGARGGWYLKLKPHKLGWAHNKQHLVDCLSEKTIIAEECMNARLPDLPPLITTVGVFVYFAPAQLVENHIQHSNDGFSPWTTMPGKDPRSTPFPRVRSTRRALIDQNGALRLASDSKMPSEYVLVETMSVLARCKRIRKRVCQIQRNARLIGNVAIIYEFLEDGPLPDLYPVHSRNAGYQPKKIVHFAPEPREEEPIMMLDDVDDMALHENNVHHEEIVVEEVEDHPDVPPTGYDEEFNEDPNEQAANLSPYYEIARQLSTGHIYLTVRHRKLASDFSNVLHWIVNSNTVDERQILNETKPLHPPLVHNARSYAFFVVATAIFPHDINRDDFSPWSQNGGPLGNQINYRTKVRKIGVPYNPETAQFSTELVKDYKLYPFHLVYLYSINPRDPRLRKKIFYVMETQSKMVVSHALILYEYNEVGSIVKLNTQTRPYHPVDVLREAEDTDVPEEARRSPFHKLQTTTAGLIYLPLRDKEFWNDRNRCLEYLVNQPISEFLNSRIPDLPPDCTEKATFVFFLNGEEVNYRSLTVDKLAPWSESSNVQGAKRPKSSKMPLYLNSSNRLRVCKNHTDPSEYQLHIYTATLPRCQRLRKKIIYIQHDGRPFGNAMIMYQFTESGPMPHPIYGGVPWPEGSEEPPQMELHLEHEMIIGEEVVIEEAVTSRTSRPPAQAGFVRGAKRNEALWRIAQQQFGASSGDETFDDIFKLLYEKDEARLLYLINTHFNVDIYAEEEPIGDHVHFMHSLDEQQGYLRERLAGSAGRDEVEEDDSEKVMI